MLNIEAENKYHVGIFHMEYGFHKYLCEENLICSGIFTLEELLRNSNENQDVNVDMKL